MSREHSDRAQFWTKHVAALGSSGLSQRDYSRKHGLHEGSLSKWRKRLGDKKLKRPPQLVPVEIVDASPKVPGASFRLAFPRHGAVEISGDAGAVTKVIQMLRWEGV